jgi:hypothetical protein
LRRGAGNELPPSRPGPRLRASNTRDRSRPDPVQ